MNSFHYWLIVVGVIFIATNVYVGGIQLIFPTCIGYGMICFAAANLKDEDSFFGHLVIPSAILGVLSFPDLFKFVIYAKNPGSESLYWFDKLVFYPYSALHIGVMAGIAVAIARQARSWKIPGLFKLSIVTATAVVLFEIPRFFIVPFTSREIWLVFFIITTIYFMLLVWIAGWAATSLP